MGYQQIVIPHNIITVRQVVSFTLDLSFFLGLISIIYKVCIEFEWLVVNVLVSFSSLAPKRSSGSWKVCLF